MYCNSCGSQISDTAQFCTYCGNQVAVANNAPIYTNSYTTYNGSIGYSSRINDPAFAKYVKNSDRYAGIFGIMLAIAAVIGFYIAGEVSNELDNPESLFYGFIIAGMFLLITFFTILGKKKSKTWDGVVVDKKVEKKQRRVNTNSDDSYMETYIVYTVFIRSNEGKKHEIRVENDDTRYNYFQIGDHLRHHKGLNTYEKYDKSRDTVIFCNACSTMHSIHDEYCRRCKCPLLK